MNFRRDEPFVVSFRIPQNLRKEGGYYSSLSMQIIIE